MSIQWVGWVLDHSEATGSDRLVLLSLANHANQSGACWPSVETISREARLSVRRTHDALRRLEAAGALVRLLNAATGDPDRPIRADRRPNLYRIQRSDGVDDASSPTPERGVDAPSRTGRTLAAVTGWTDRPPEPSMEPSPEPSTSRAAAPVGFDEFWSAYPRKEDKGKARRAWTTATKKAKPDVVVAAAKAYAALRHGEDARYTKLPASWLNAEAWENPVRRPGSRPAGRPIDTDRSGPSGEVQL